MERPNIIKPGYFTAQVAADSRRMEFDCKNEVIIANKVPVDFVFIGDSITQMWELNAYFGKKGRLILNRGIGGDNTEFVRKRFEADALQLKPKYCIMKIGVNDSWGLEDDPWSGKRGMPVDVIENKVVDNILAIINMAIEKEQKLIVCSILPTNMTFTQKTKERNEYIKNINTRVQKICNEKEIIYVDYHSHFVCEDGLTLKDGLTLEGLHPHVGGYNIMADVLRKTLAQNGIEI